MSAITAAQVEGTSVCQIAQLSINTIRTLCMDAVQQANSGHPGTRMAMAPAEWGPPDAQDLISRDGHSWWSE